MLNTSQSATDANSTSLVDAPPAGAPSAITTVARGGGTLPKLELQASYQALASALQSNYEPTETFRIAGEVLTRDQVIARVNDFIAIVEATKAVRQEWLAAVQAERSALGAIKPLRQGVQGIVQAWLGGKGAAKLASFGFKPASPGKKTVATKAAAAAKAASTREARHTMGSVQKKAIHGDVAGVLVTPLVATAPAPAHDAPSVPSAAGHGAESFL